MSSLNRTYDPSEVLETLASAGTKVSAAALIDLIAQTGDSDLSEVVKIGRTIFLRPAEKRARDRRRALGKRQNPKASRARKLSRIKNRAKITAGLRRFKRSSKGKAQAKDTVKFRKRFNSWVELLAPGLLQIDEQRLDQTPFQELRLLVAPAFQTSDSNERVDEATELLDAIMDFLNEADIVGIDEGEDQQTERWYWVLAEEIMEGMELQYPDADSDEELEDVDLDAPSAGDPTIELGEADSTPKPSLMEQVLAGANPYDILEVSYRPEGESRGPRNARLSKGNEIPYWDRNARLQTGTISTPPGDGKSSLTLSDNKRLLFNQFESWWEASDVPKGRDTDAHKDWVLKVYKSAGGNGRQSTPELNPVARGSYSRIHDTDV